MTTIDTIRIGDQEAVLTEWQHTAKWSQLYMGLKRLPADIDPKFPDTRDGRMTRQRERAVCRRQNGCYTVER